MRKDENRALPTCAESFAASKKPYTPPALNVFGDVRDVTMGVSPGMGESGNPELFRI